MAAHAPALTLFAADTGAIAEYIHSVHATMGGQGSPPGRNPTNLDLNVLVGDAKAGEAVFRGRVLGVPLGDRRPEGHRLEVPGSARAPERVGARLGGRFGGGGGGGGPVPAIVTLADGSKLEGTLVRKDDWLVILTLPDGTRRSMARTNGVPKVDVKDPSEAHREPS